MKLTLKKKRKTICVEKKTVKKKKWNHVVANETERKKKASLDDDDFYLAHPARFRHRSSWKNRHRTENAGHRSNEAASLLLCSMALILWYELEEETDFVFLN
jgi:hypothetical protein